MSEHRQPPIETDPLGAIRKELLNAAWRKKAADDRRRRLLVTASTAAVSLVCAVGGAGAAGVDVPVIGDALRALSAADDRRDETDVSGQRDPTAPLKLAEIRPGPGNSTDSVTFPWGDGGTGAAAAYLNTQDQVCFVVAGPEGEAERGGCMAAQAMAQRIDEGAALVVGVASHESTVVTGYVEPELDDVRVRGPQGRLEVRLSAPWTPDVPRSTAVKAFVATAPSPVRGELTLEADEGVLDLRKYVIEGRLPDGRTVTVRP